jgi:heme a synthase
VAASRAPGACARPVVNDRRRALGWATVGAVFLLMTIGNIVSATGSGLACPDWPLCHGRLIPPLQPDVLIEYSHRLTAALASILLIATIVAAVRAGDSRGSRRIGLALAVLLAAQIGLGGVTVLLKLPHLISTAHLVNALLILGGLVLLVSRADTAAARTPKIARLARAGVAALLVQLALGGYVRHAGAGLACPDFPLCSGELLPGHWLAVVHWVHRWLGVALLGFFIQLAAASRRTPLGGATALAAALATLQVALGIAAVLLRLTPPIRATHAAVGYALWGTLVWISVRAGSWPTLAAKAPASREPARETVPGPWRPAPRGGQAKP